MTSRNALIVGINQYPNLNSLRLAATDAEAVAQILEQQGDFRITRLPEVVMKDKKVMIGQNTEVSVTQLEEALIQLFYPDHNQEPDEALFYFAGHGIRKQKGLSEGFLATSDINLSNVWGLSLQWLRRLLQKSPIKTQIVWLDCCYSGGLLNFNEADPSDKGAARDRCFIAASRAFEVAYEEIAGNHGVLTNVLLRALDCTHKNEVTGDELIDIVKNELKTTTQGPVTSSSGGRIVLTFNRKQDNSISLLGQEKGGELISVEFFAEQEKKHGDDTDLKQAFYGGKKTVQWYGIDQQLDAPRQAYEAAKRAITNSFANDDAVAMLIKGDGGSGKSVFLRRLAHDLCTDYRVYWLEDIQNFLDCEWICDVLKQSQVDTPPKYLIFLEDWYQHVENSGLQKEAAELLAKVSKTAYVRLVIGDRLAKPGSKKAYDIHVPRLNIFELNASENLCLLETIFTQMPEWRAKATQEQIEKAANASLFQLLFIFQYAEDMSGTITDIYHRIFASDCRVLLDRSTDFWKGMTKALYFYANLYTSDGVIITLEFLRDLAAYLGDCTIPMRYSAGIEDLANDKLLKKYFGLKTVNRKNTDVVNYFCFHHDTMADNGWMLLGDLVGEQYDETLLQAMLKSFQDKYSWIVGSIYYRQSRLSGEKGMEAARAYLNLSHPESNQNAFESCLKKLRNEPLAQKKAQDFLETKEPWGVETAFRVCLNLFKAKEFAKDLIQKRAQDFLNTEKPWEIQEAFTFCLNLLKTEVLAKDKARDFLKTEKPWENHTEFNVCLELFKNEDFAKEKARDFLKTEKPWENFWSFSVCLDLLKTEVLAKDKARDFLKTEKPWEIKEAFNVCLNLLKTEELAKDLVQNKARDFLKTEKPWENYQAFTVCLNLLKTEDLAKEKARDFLETGNPWTNNVAFTVCLNVLKDDQTGIDKAVFILENRYEFNADHHWPLLYRSLGVLHDKREHQQLVTLIANEIIANRYSMSNQYLQILKIPLFYVPQWLQNTKHCIRNWNKLNSKNPQKPWIYRNTLNSITISYKEKPDLLETMCLGLIRNWRFELHIQQKHQAYFIRCLAHPAIQSNNKLRQEVIAICNEILHDNTQPPLILNEGTRVWLQNIVENNQFPEWDFELDS